MEVLWQPAARCQKCCNQIVIKTWAYECSITTTGMTRLRRPAWRVVTGPNSPYKLSSLRAAYATLKLKHTEYHDSKNRDFVKMAAAKAVLLENSTLNKDSRLTASLLKQMKPYCPRHQMRIADVDGIPAETFVQEKHVIQNHFAGILEAEVTSMGQHILAQRATLQLNAEKMHPLSDRLQLCRQSPYLPGKCTHQTAQDHQ